MDIQPIDLEQNPEFIKLSPERQTAVAELIASKLPEDSRGFFLEGANKAVEKLSRESGVGRVYNEERVIDSIRQALPSDFDKLDDDAKVLAIDKAKEEVEEKAAEVDPVNKNDTGFYSRMQLSGLQRQILGKEVGEFGDKFKRFTGGLIQSVASPFSEEGTTEMLNRYLPTNPEYDTTAASKFTQAAGDFVGQIGQFAAISALAGVSGGTSLGLLGVRAGSTGARVALAASFAQNASRKFQENYNLATGEMGLSEDEAIQSGLAGMPGAVIDSLGEALILRGIKLGSANKAFTSMTAAEKASEIVKKGSQVIKSPTAMATISKNLFSGFMKEAVTETLGDAATGWGGYATTGHEGFIPTAASLWDSFWIGGVLGGTAQVALGAKSDLRNQRALKNLGEMDQNKFMSMTEQAQNDVANLMDQERYAEAASYINRYKATVSQMQQPSAEQAKIEPNAQPATPLLPKMGSEGAGKGTNVEEEALADIEQEYNQQLDAALNQVKRPENTPEVNSAYEKLTNKIQATSTAVKNFVKFAMSPTEGASMSLDQVSKAINTSKQDGKVTAQEEVPATPDQQGNVAEGGKKGLSEAAVVPMAGQGAPAGQLDGQKAGQKVELTPEIKNTQALIQAFVSANLQSDRKKAAKSLIQLLVAGDKVIVDGEEKTLSKNPSKSFKLEFAEGGSLDGIAALDTLDNPESVIELFPKFKEAANLSPSLQKAASESAQTPSVSPEPNAAQPDGNQKKPVTKESKEAARKQAKKKAKKIKNEIKVQETGSVPVEQGKPPVETTEGKTEEGAKDQEGEGEIDPQSASDDIDDAQDDIENGDKEFKEKKSKKGKKKSQEVDVLASLREILMRRVDRMSDILDYAVSTLGVDTFGRAQALSADNAITSLVDRISSAKKATELETINAAINKLADQGTIVSKSQISEIKNELQRQVSEGLISQDVAQSEIQQNLEADQSGRLFQRGKKAPLPKTFSEIDDQTAEFQALGKTAQEMLKSMTPEQIAGARQLIADLKKLGIDDSVSESDKIMALEIERAINDGQYPDGLNQRINEAAPSRAIFQRSVMALKQFGPFAKQVIMMQLDVQALNWLKTGGSIQSFYARVPNIIVQSEFSGTFMVNGQMETSRGELITTGETSQIAQITESGSEKLILGKKRNAPKEVKSKAVPVIPFSPIPNTIVLTAGHYNIDTLIHESDHNMIVTGTAQRIVEATEGGNELWDAVLAELGVERDAMWTVAAHEKWVEARAAWMQNALPPSNVFSRVFNLLKGIYNTIYKKGVLTKNRNMVLEKAFEKIYSIDTLTAEDVKQKVSRDIGKEAGLLLGHVPMPKLPYAQKVATSSKLISKSQPEKEAHIKKELSNFKSQQKGKVAENNEKEFTDDEVNAVIIAAKGVENNSPDEVIEQELGEKKLDEKQNYSQLTEEQVAEQQQQVERLQVEKARGFISSIRDFFMKAYKAGEMEGEVYSGTNSDALLAMAREYFSSNIEMGKSDLIYVIKDLPNDEANDWMPEEIMEYSRFMMNIVYIGYDQVSEVLERNPSAKIYDFMADNFPSGNQAVNVTGDNPQFTGKVNEAVNTGLPRNARAMNPNQLATGKIEDVLDGLSLKTRKNKDGEAVYTAESKRKIAEKLDALYPEGWVVKSSMGYAGSGIYTKTGTENKIVQNFEKSKIIKDEYVVESFDPEIANPVRQYRVHGYVRNGVVEIVPYATGDRFSKNPFLIRTEIVKLIEGEVSKFAAKMTGLKEGDVFGFDAIQKSNGLIEVVEVNPTEGPTETTWGGKSGYLDYPLYNIALASHIQGRTPAHVLIARIAARNKMNELAPSLAFKTRIESIYQNFKDYTSFAREMVRNFGDYIIDYVRGIWSNLVSNKGKLTSRANGVVSAIERADAAKQSGKAGTLFQMEDSTSQQMLEQGIISQDEYNLSQRPSIYGLTPEQLLEQGIISQGEYNLIQGITVETEKQSEDKSDAIQKIAGYLMTPKQNQQSTQEINTPAYGDQATQLGMNVTPAAIQKSIELELSEEELVEVANEVNEQSWGDEAKIKGIKLFSEWVNGEKNVSEKIANLFARVWNLIKVALVSGLAISPFLVTTYAGYLLLNGSNNKADQSQLQQETANPRPFIDSAVKNVKKLLRSNKEIAQDFMSQTEIPAETKQKIKELSSRQTSIDAVIDGYEESISSFESDLEYYKTTTDPEFQKDSIGTNVKNPDGGTVSISKSRMIELGEQMIQDLKNNKALIYANASRLAGIVSDITGQPMTGYKIKIKGDSLIALAVSDKLGRKSFNASIDKNLNISIPAFVLTGITSSDLETKIETASTLANELSHVAQKNLNQDWTSDKTVLPIGSIKLSPVVKGSFTEAMKMFYSGTRMPNQEMESFEISYLAARAFAGTSERVSTDAQIEKIIEKVVTKNSVGISDEINLINDLKKEVYRTGSSLFQMSEGRRAETLRFNELTADLYNGGNYASQEQIDAWKEANPDKWQELTEMRAQVLRDGGWDVEAYHSTKKSFSEFDPNQSTVYGEFWFSDSPNQDLMQASTQMRVFLRMDNPSTNPFDNITRRIALQNPDDDFEGLKGDAAKDAITKLKMNYDSVIFQGNFAGAGSATGNAYLVFNPNQIKSAEPISAGLKVTPDQWADTGRDSILYQMSEGRRTQVDQEYLAAVEDGDMDAAQRIVDEITLTNFPSVSNGLASEIQERKARAHENGEVESSWAILRSLMEESENPKSFANIFKKELDSIAIEMGLYTPITQEQMDNTVMLGRAKKYDLKKDGVFYKFNSYELMPFNDELGSLDDDGNAIPPSERFNLSSSSTLFQMSDDNRSQMDQDAAAKRNIERYEKSTYLSTKRVDLQNAKRFLDIASKAAAVSKNPKQIIDERLESANEITSKYGIMLTSDLEKSIADLDKEITSVATEESNQLFQMSEGEENIVSDDDLRQLGGMYQALARLNARLGGMSPIDGKVMKKLQKANNVINDALNQVGGKAKSVTQAEKQKVLKLIRKVFSEVASNVGEDSFNRLIKDARQYAFAGEALAGDSFNPQNNIQYSKDMSDAEKERFELQQRIKKMAEILRRDSMTGRLKNTIKSHMRPLYHEVAGRLSSLISRGIDNVLSAFNDENKDLIKKFSDQIFLFAGKETDGQPMFVEDFLKTIEEVEEAMFNHMVREFVAYNELYFVQEEGEYPEIDAILSQFPRKEGETAIQYYNRLNEMKQQIEAIYSGIEGADETAEDSEEAAAKKAEAKQKLRKKREDVINKNQNDLRTRFPSFEDYLADKELRHGGAHSEKFNEVMRLAFEWATTVDVSGLSDEDVITAHHLVVTMLTGGNHSAMMHPWVVSRRESMIQSWKDVASGLYDRVKDSRLVRPIFMGAERSTIMKRLFNSIDRSVQANLENFNVWVDRISKYPAVRAWMDRQFLGEFQAGAFTEATNAAKNSVTRLEEIVKAYNDELDNTVDANPMLWAVSNLMQYNVGSDARKQFIKNVRKARNSVDPKKVANKANSNTNSLSEAARNSAALESLLDGIDLKSDTAWDEFNRVVYDRMGYGNPELSDKRAQLLSDMQELFMEGIADQIFVTEVLMQKRFTTVNNYLPMMTDRIDGSMDKIDIMDMEANREYMSGAAGINSRANETRKAASPDRILGLDLFKSVETKLYRNAIDVHSKLPTYFLVNEIFRFKTVRTDDGVYMKPVSPLVKEIWGDGEEVKGQIDAIKEKIVHQLTQIYRMTEPPNSLVSGIRTVNSMIQSMMLSGMGQVFQQAGAAIVDYSARESGNSRYLIDAAIYWSKNYEKCRNWLFTNYRDLYDRGDTQGILENEKTFRNLGSELSRVDSIKDKMDTLRRFMTLSLRYGDKIGSELIFIAEHMKAVEQAGLIPDIKAYDIELYSNPALTTRAAAQLSRYVGPSSAAGRSWWMSDHKQAYSVLRALTGSFQSSAHNMSSQMLGAARNFMDLMKDGTPESRAEARAELRKIGSIMAQQATFTTLRHMFNGMLVLATVSAIRSAFDDEDDAIEKAQLKLEKVRKTKRMSKAEKERAINEAERELADAKAIRRAVINMKQQASADAWGKGMIRDQVANLHVFNSFGDAFVPKMFMMPINSAMEESFKATNEATIGKLKKERSAQLALGNRVEAAKLQEKITDMEAIDYIPLFYEKKDKSGFGGIIGGVLDPVYSGYKEASEDIMREDRDFLTARAFVPDLISYMAAAGVGQADVNRITRQLQRIDDELSSNRLEEKERTARDIQELTNKSGRRVSPRVSWEQQIIQTR